MSDETKKALPVEQEEPFIIEHSLLIREENSRLLRLRLY